jgi:hypothetical protein
MRTSVREYKNKVRASLRLFISFALICFALTAGAQTGGPPAAPGEHLIGVPQCRILDTRLTADQPGTRKVNIRASECGRILPPFATGYAIRITTLDKAVPEQARVAPVLTLNRIADGPDGTVSFPIPGNAHVTVDVIGYYAPASIPVDSLAGAAGVAPGVEGTTVSQPAAPGVPRRKATTESVPGGSGSGIYFDGEDSSFSDTGILLKALAGTVHPWVTARIGSSDAGSGFRVLNTNGTNLLSLTGDGIMNMPAANYLNGRTHYWGTANAAIPDNIVHNVNLVNPLDSNTSAVNRVVFFSGTTGDEVGSPATTKFQAYTLGFYGQQNISFDSQLHYHRPGAPFYHFRAFSATGGGQNADPDKDTFWVKADTDFDSLHSTRADMYVSGNVGIGTTTPSTKLDVAGPVLAGSRIAIGQQASVLKAGYSNFYSAELASYIPSTAPGVDSVGWKIRPYYYGKGGLFDALTVTPYGTVGIGTTVPGQMLSVAGTIESTSGGFKFPDGSIQTMANPFTFNNGVADVNRSAASLISSVTNTSSSGTAALAAVAGDGTTSSHIAYVRLATSETSPRDWRVGMIDGAGSFKVRDNAAGVDRMTISGNSISFNGNVTGTSIQANYQDVAEWVPASEHLEPGTVVVLNPSRSNEVMRSTRAYDTAAAGVVSLRPGIILGQAAESKAQVATTGRVRVKVDASREPIRVGDLLVTSDVPGYAMKSIPLSVGGASFHRPGTLIGKALEPLESGTGEILVLLSLQ